MADLSIWPTSGWTRDGSQKAFAHQFAGDDFASLFVHTKMGLAIVPVLWWRAQLPDMNRQAAAVDQNVHRRLAGALVEGDLAQLRLTPRDRGVIGDIVVELQKLEQRCARPPTSSPTETYAVCRLTRSYVNFLEGQIGRLSFLYTLLEQLDAPAVSFRADGAYDTRALYAALLEAGTPDIEIAIPPRRTASSCRLAAGNWLQREQAIRRIAEVGRRQWRKESGANQQARAENRMFRFKRVLGDRLRLRSPEEQKTEGQKTEAMIGVNILNRMTKLGMPESRAVGA